MINIDFFRHNNFIWLSVYSRPQVILNFYSSLHNFILLKMYFFIQGGMDDDQVKAVLKQAFLGVEKEFFDSIGDELLEKTLIQEEINVSKEAVLVHVFWIYLLGFIY